LLWSSPAGIRRTRTHGKGRHASSARARASSFATVSHELRTPLAAIYGSALTLARDDIEFEEAVYAKLLDVIVEESGRLADIVNDLLLASQLDAGRLEVRIVDCNGAA
jgi:two-component system, OmpR family, sensor histidine kinase VanS